MLSWWALVPSSSIHLSRQAGSSPAGQTFKGNHFACAAWLPQLNTSPPDYFCLFTRSAPLSGLRGLVIARSQIDSTRIFCPFASSYWQRPYRLTAHPSFTQPAVAARPWLLPKPRASTIILLQVSTFEVITHFSLQPRTEVRQRL